MKKVISFTLSLVLIVAVTFNVSAQTKERKGWSPQAKGAVIGAATGGAAGAIIHKRNRVVGGAVGAVVGAGAGYGVGKIIDNKQKKKEAERIAEANRQAAEARTANARLASAKRTSAPARTVAPKPAANTMVAMQPAAASFDNANSMAYLASNMFLPNPYYGDRDKPYHSSEYRRKSW